MCKTEAAQQMPLNTAPNGATLSANDGQGDFGAPGGDPLSIALQRESAANPTTVSVNAPTKFGKLMNLITPMLEGAAVGGFSGKGHPGGGFGAAQEFYDKQNARKLQLTLLQRNLQNDQVRNALEVARTAHEINRPNFPNGRVTPGQDASGNPVLLRPNPVTGVYEPIDGYSPADKDNDSVQHVMTDQGLVLLDRKSGKARLATLDDNGQAPAATGAPMGAPRSTGVVQFGGKTYPMNVAQVPGAPPQSPGAIRTGRAVGSLQGNGAPLMPPSKPQHENDFSQFYDKWLDDNSQDDTAANRLKAREQYSAAGRKPSADESPNMSPKEYRKRQGQYTDQLTRGFSASEQQRTKELNALSKDVMAQSSPDDLAAKQQQIEEENADRKQALHQRIVDAASGQGIDMGQVPDYRAQLDGGGQASGGQSNGAPRNAPGANAQGDKVATPMDVMAWAQKKGISSIEARKQFKARGYRLVPIPRNQ